MIQAVFGGFGRFLHPFLLTTCDSADFVAIVSRRGYGRWLVVQVLGAASDGLWNSAGDGMRLVGSIGP